MAQLINLYGVQTLTPTTDNNFSLVYDGNVRSENNNEVRLLVDTSLQVVPAPVNIYLPPINSFKGIWTLQLYVVDVSGSAGTNPINIIATGGDNVDGVAQTQVANAYGNCVLTIASFGYWTTYGSASGGGGGGGGMITTTYANFYNTMSQGNLIAGANYRITDYQSKNFINGWETAQNNPSPSLLNAGVVIPTYNSPSVISQVTGKQSICPLPDGSAIVGNSGGLLRKFDVNGVEIASFTANVGSGGDGNSINAIAVQSTGKIIVAGNFITWQTNPYSYIVRLNADGTYDPTFTPNLGTGFDNTIFTIAVQSDDSILVGGAFGNVNGILSPYFTRLLANGTPDAVFIANVQGLGSFNSTVTKIIVQPDTNILLCGNFNNVYSGVNLTYITRLDIAGNLDLIFANNVFAPSGFSGGISDMALQPDGSIVVVGSFAFWNGNNYNYIARLFADGSDDVGFNLGIGTGFSNSQLAVAVQPDGYILVGTFSAMVYNGNPFQYMCRLDPFGVFDTTFSQGFGNLTVYSIAIQPTTNNILVGKDGDYVALYPSPITNPDFDARQVYTSPNTETLIVKAIDGFNIEQNVYSEQYPLDIIEYLPQVNNLGFETEYYTGNVDPNGNLIVDFNLKWDGTRAYFDMPVGFPVQMGHFCYIYCAFDGFSYSLDVLAEPILFGINNPMDYNQNSLTDAHTTIEVNSTGTRIYLNDITNAQFLQYDTDSLYVDCVYAYEPTTGWITRRNYTAWNINYPADWRNQKFRRYQVNLTEAGIIDYLWWNDDNFITGVVQVGGAKDYFVVNEDTFNIQCVGTGGASPWWYTGYTDNNVMNVTANFRCGEGTAYNTFRDVNQTSLGDYVERNLMYGFTYVFKADGQFFNNIFTGNYNGVEFGTNCTGNAFWGLTASNLKVGNNFQTNRCKGTGFANATFGNDSQQNITEFGNFLNCTFGDYFRFNTTNFLNCTDNSFGEFFEGNNLSGQFRNNNFGNAFQNNTLTGVFNENIGKDSFIGNSIGGTTLACTFGSRTTTNTITNNFQYNSCGDDFVNNIIQASVNDNNVFGRYFQNNIINGGSFYRNYFDAYCLFNTLTNAVFHDNGFGYGFSQNTFTNGQFYNITAGNNFSSNQIVSYMIYTSFGNDCISNQFLGAVSGNVFGDFCQNNICGVSSNLQNNKLSLNFSANTIDAIFHDNTISALCQQNTFPFSTVGNTISGTTFSQNAIQTTFSHNVISYTMVNCITAGGGGVSFRFNDIQSDLTSIDFSLATFVYANYNKTIQRGNLGTSILTYWNEGTNTYSWALPTA